MKDVLNLIRWMILHEIRKNKKKSQPQQNFSEVDRMGFSCIIT